MLLITQVASVCAVVWGLLQNLVPRTGGANEFVVRRCVDTPDNFVAGVLVDESLIERTSQRTHEPKKRSVPLSSLHCLRLCLHCVRGFAAQSTRYKERGTSTKHTCKVLGTKEGRRTTDRHRSCHYAIPRHSCSCVPRAHCHFSAC